MADWRAWSLWIWALHGIGVLYLVGFFAAWFRFRAAAARVRQQGAEAEAAFNRAIRGFPWAFYAKMLGEHTYHAPDAQDEAPGPDRSR